MKALSSFRACGRLFEKVRGDHTPLINRLGWIGLIFFVFPVSSWAGQNAAPSKLVHKQEALSFTPGYKSSNDFNELYGGLEIMVQLRQGTPLTLLEVHETTTGPPKISHLEILSLTEQDRLRVLVASHEMGEADSGSYTVAFNGRSFSVRQSQVVFLPPFEFLNEIAEIPYEIFSCGKDRQFLLVMSVGDFWGQQTSVSVARLDDSSYRLVSQIRTDEGRGVPGSVGIQPLTEGRSLVCLTWLGKGSGHYIYGDLHLMDAKGYLSSFPDFQGKLARFEDVDQDGRVEVLLAARFLRFKTEIYPFIYEWSGAKFVPAPKKFKKYYKRTILPKLEKSYREFLRDGDQPEGIAREIDQAYLEAIREVKAIIRTGKYPEK